MDAVPGVRPGYQSWHCSFLARYLGEVAQSGASWHSLRFHRLTVLQTPGPFSSSLPSGVAHTTRMPPDSPSWHLIFWRNYEEHPPPVLQNVWTVNSKIPCPKPCPFISSFTTFHLVRYDLSLPSVQIFCLAPDLGTAFAEIV